MAALAVGFAQGALLLALVAWLVFRPRHPPLTASAVFAVATEWLVLGVLLETVVGRAARGLSWSEIAARYRPGAGHWESPAIALCLFLIPLAVGLARRRRTECGAD